MKPQKVVKNKDAKKAVVINEKHQALIEGKSTSDKPIRAVYFVEIGSLSPAQVQSLYTQLSSAWAKAQGGMHYVIPVRNGKLSGDIVFEKEILNTINALCEVKDGQIALKNNYEEVVVIRTLI